MTAVLGSNFLWPVLGAVGLVDVGWYASLLLWFVLMPVGAVMLVVSVLQAGSA